MNIQIEKEVFIYKKEVDDKIKIIDDLIYDDNKREEDINEEHILNTENFSDEGTVGRRVEEEIEVGRRRLAGHNRRRRKTQPAVASPKLQPTKQENSTSNSQDKRTNIPLSERDSLVQFISKSSASNSGNPSAKSLEPGGFDLNVRIKRCATSLL